MHSLAIMDPKGTEGGTAQFQRPVEHCFELRNRNSSVLAILVVDYGPWNKPKMKPTEMTIYSTTGEAARAAGATITPTEPMNRRRPAPRPSIR
jgi:hypothetical protein